MSQDIFEPFLISKISFTSFKIYHQTFKRNKIQMKEKAYLQPAGSPLVGRELSFSFFSSFFGFLLSFLLPLCSAKIFGQSFLKEEFSNSLSLPHLSWAYTIFLSFFSFISLSLFFLSLALLSFSPDASARPRPLFIVEESWNRWQ